VKKEKEALNQQAAWRHPKKSFRDIAEEDMSPSASGGKKLRTNRGGGSGDWSGMEKKDGSGKKSAQKRGLEKRKKRQSPPLLTY